MAFDEGKIERDQENTEANVQKFMRGYETFLSSAYNDILKDIKAGNVRAAEAFNLLNKINETLEAQGLEEELAKLGEIYSKEIKKIKDEFLRLDARIESADFYTNADIETITGLVEFDKDIIRTNTFMHSDELKSSVMRAVISSDYQQVALSQAAIQKRTVSTVETEIRTGISGFNQTIRNEKAEKYKKNLFVYIGEFDKVTRPFCADLISRGRVFTKEQIMQMDNGQGLPVMTYGGGYNCRHGWFPIDEKEAKVRYGYDS